MSHNISEHTISIRIASPTEEDARCVMEWRNDPVTLLNSYHREPKIWDSFWKEFQGDYFQNQKIPPIFVLNDALPVAFLKFKKISDPRERESFCCDISINVNPQMRGRGLGVLALKEGVKFLHERKVITIIAEIRIENKNSIAAFEKSGFHFFDKTTKHIEDTGEVCQIYRYLHEK